MRGFRSAAVAGFALQCAALPVSLPPGVVVVAALSIGSAPAFARDYVVQQLRIEDPYVRPTPAGARTGGAYFTIRNTGTTADRLLRVATPAAASAELHSMTMDGNLMKMRSVPALDIPAGGTVTLGPGGYHAMLVGLAHPLSTGTQVPLTLTFEKAGTIEIAAPVEARDAGAAMAHRP